MESETPATTKYFGSWSRYDEVGPSWGNYDYEARKDDIPENFPTDAEILFASYGGGSYEGDALVIYERDGKLHEAHGSHCSCYGLEDQWKPEETSWEAMAMRERPGTDKYGYHFLHDHESAAQAAYWALVDAHVPPVAQSGGSPEAVQPSDKKENPE